MGRTSAVFRLPIDVQSELNRRLIDANFTGFDKHTAWLKSTGHDVSRSAVHRYGKALEGLQSVEVGSAAEGAELRMRCAEVAATFCSPSDLLDRASNIYLWVTTGRR